jgi:hypothetical protein
MAFYLLYEISNYVADYLEIGPKARTLTAADRFKIDKHHLVKVIILLTRLGLRHNEHDDLLL